MKILIAFAFFIMVCSCSRQPNLLEITTPFPISDVNDDKLEQNFQTLATDSRLLAYQLVDVRTGNLAAGQGYQIPFVAPGKTQIILVSACGHGCTLPTLSMKAISEIPIGNTSYGVDRSYLSLNVGTHSKSYIGEISLPDCKIRTCSAYWALYARTLP